DLLCAPARGRRYPGGYCVLEPGPILYLYGVSRRAQPSATNSALSDGLLSGDRPGRGLRWSVCRGARAVRLRLVRRTAGGRAAALRPDVADVADGSTRPDAAYPAPLRIDHSALHCGHDRRLALRCLGERGG